MSSPVDIPGSRLRHSDDGDALHPRHSPTLVRPVDPNDPAYRERQRDMDVDMAMQLSRARRETISVGVPTSPVASPAVLALPLASSDLGVPAFSTTEQHDLELAKGEVDDDALDISESPAQGQDEPAPEILSPKPLPGILSMDIRGGQDPSLLVTSQTHESPPRLLHSPSLNHGLPTYQDTSSSPYHFDFSLMEAFAAEEKGKLGLASSTSPRFSLSQIRSLKKPSAPDGDATLSATLSAGPSSEATTPRPSARQRRLSHSNRPRHRKGIGGKLALFEAGNSADGSLSPRFGSIFSSGNAPPFDDSGVEAPGPSASGGILNAGHDRPYRFSFYSNSLGATIHARSLGELPAEGQTFSDLFHGIPAPGRSRAKTSGATDDESTTWWLDILSPTDEEMKMLGKVFGIHPLTTEDILMEEAREKIELFRNYYLVCFRSFEQDPYSPTYLEPLNMYILVFREGTLSFHFRQTPHPQSVRRRIKQLKDYISVTSDWISYALIDDITDAFGPLIQSIEYEVDSIDELVLILKEAEQSDMLRRIGTCRKKVMGLLRLMGNKADVVKGLAKRCNENWRVAPTSDIGLYLSDIQDHLITMTQNLNHYEKILSRSHSNYLAQISIEITDANNQINDVLSKLTALGTVLIPMNLVTGLWGMNVHVPGEGVGGYYWFGGIISVLIAFACIGGFVTYRFMVQR